MTPFKITEKKMKCLGINLTKSVEDLFEENYKILKSSWIGKINIIKMSILPKAIYTFNTIPNYTKHSS